MKYFKDNNNQVFVLDENIKEDKLNIYIKEFNLTSITETEAKVLRSPTLDDLKTSKLLFINTSCETAIVGGFTSSALGYEHIYPSQRDDQLNLQGLIIDGENDFFKCKVTEDETAVWELKPHTIDQLVMVGKALKSHVKTNTARAYELKAQINAATTVEELDGIVW